MIEPISQEQFRKCFTPVRGPEGSLLSRIQLQCVETGWYWDDATNRIGVVIYDSRGADWQVVTLEDCGLGYSTHEVRTSLPTEKEAIEALRGLFSCETGETTNRLAQMNRQSVAHSGRTMAEVLMGVPLDGQATKQ